MNRCHIKEKKGILGRITTKKHKTAGRLTDRQYHNEQKCYKSSYDTQQSYAQYTRLTVSLSTLAILHRESES